MSANPELQVDGSPLGALLSAVIEALGESVVVLDRDGRVAYASEGARAAVDTSRGRAGLGGDVVAELLKLGGRRVRLQVGDFAMGEAVFLATPGESTLAQRERQAILQTLRETGGRLALAARHLGISRTTLWRRLKEYGVRRNP
jgi:transcriptional regulator with PAS, ATPase and Fis domain